MNALLASFADSGQLTAAAVDRTSTGETSAQDLGDVQDMSADLGDTSTAVTSSPSPSRERLSAHRGFEPDVIIRKFIRQRLLTDSNDLDINDEENFSNMINSETESDLLEILDILTEELAGRGSSELHPRYPTGSWAWTTCQVCLEPRWLYNRPCCDMPVCSKCLKTYFSVKVNEGVVKIECCNNKCGSFIHRDEITDRLDALDKQKFHQFLLQANADSWLKTCPRCNHPTSLDKKIKPNHMSSNKKHPLRSRLICSECDLAWCFTCHAPWHNDFTCKENQKGDRLMKRWANQIQQGQLNAQKCPQCQAYIQRTTGCDHMHCSRCKTDFCYRCGDRLRKLRFFGDHYSKLSVFGCKYRYKADKPLQRKFTRAAVFGSKLMVVPLLGTLGACACVIALGFGIFILPVYGGVRLYNKINAPERQEDH